MLEQSLFLSIDLGTTEIKAGIFDEKGNMLAFNYRDFLEISELKSDKIEKSQDKLWTSIKESISGVISLLSKRQKESILSLSISSHTDTMFAIGKDGKDIRPPIIWLDARGSKELKKITANFDTEKMFKITGQPEPSPMVFGNRIFWLATNEPGNFKKTHRFLQIFDFVLFKLTGEYISEATIHDGGYIFDINTKAYYKPMLDYIGIDENKLPGIIASMKNVGKLSSKAAEELGLQKNIEIIVGAMDQNCSAIGAGNCSNDIITETTGTVLAVLKNIDKPFYDFESKIPCYNQIFDDKYCLLPWTNSGGLLLKWFKDNFLNVYHDKKEYLLMDSLAEKIDAGSEGLLTIPFVDGVYTPFHNPDARAVFFGIGLKHTMGHFCRSILESNAYMLRLYLNLLKQAGFSTHEIRCIGGGAKSRIWNQIKADVTGLAVKTLKNSQSSLLGAAMIAAVGCGVYSDLISASKKMVKVQETFEPNPSHIEVYDVSFNKFLNLYNNNISLF
jgi:xylulokinase